MAAMSIYGTNPVKIFSGTKGSMTLGLGMQHRGLGPNTVCSNIDLGLTLTFLRHGQICVLILLWEKYISSENMLESFFTFQCKKFITYDQSDIRFMLI